MISILQELLKQMKQVDIEMGKWVLINDSCSLFYPAFGYSTLMMVNIANIDGTSARVLKFSINEIVCKIIYSGEAGWSSMVLDEPINVVIDELDLSEEAFFQKSLIDNFCDIDYHTYLEIVKLHRYVYDLRIDYIYNNIK